MPFELTSEKKHLSVKEMACGREDAPSFQRAHQVAVRIESPRCPALLDSVCPSGGCADQAL